MYNIAIFDRLIDLKHVGKLKVFNATGVTDKKFDENDKVKLFLNISKTGIIQNASFKAVGCVGVLVAASYICEMLEDKDLKYARKLDIIAVNKYVGEFPEDKQHAILVVLNALNNALKMYEKAVASGEIKYYAKIIEKTKASKKSAVSTKTNVSTKSDTKSTNTSSVNKTTTTTETTNKTVSLESTLSKLSEISKHSSISSEENDVTETKVDIKKEKKAPTKAPKKAVAIKSDKVDSKKAAKDSKKDLVAKSTIDEQETIKTTIVEDNKNISSESSETKSKKELDSRQISFDFDAIATKKEKTKAKKEAKKSKDMMLSKTSTDLFAVDPESTNTQEVVAVEQELPEVIVEEPTQVQVEVLEHKPTTIKKTKTTKTTTTKKVVKTDTHVAMDSYEMHSLDHSVEVDGNVVDSKKATVEKMNSSLLRLQSLQKSRELPEYQQETMLVEESTTNTHEDTSREESLNKLKALVASAKQNQTESTKNTKPSKPKKEEKPKKDKKKEEKVVTTTTAPEKSVKYVRIDEFEEKTQKEKKGLFSRIFGRK